MRTALQQQHACKRGCHCQHQQSTNINIALRRTGFNPCCHSVLIKDLPTGIRQPKSGEVSQSKMGSEEISSG
jgi:hypothetical protein